MSRDSKPQRVLVVHNSYQQKGGEDSVVEAEVELLRQNGHAVELLARSNFDIDHMSRATAAAQTLWSRQTSAQIGELSERFRPDLVHVHNSFPLVSPSVYWAAQAQGLPVVQTLHNFRLLCPQGMLLRNGSICEDCVGHLPWRGVVRRCYRDSLAQSAVLGSTLSLHRALGTYRRKIDAYIALNTFCRDKFIEGGLPAGRIHIKPNFLNPPDREPGTSPRSGGLFVGRLSQDKGMGLLLSLFGADSRLHDAPIRIIGRGDYEDQARSVMSDRYLGFLGLEAILEHLERASFLVVPSLWYENFPRTIIEAFSRGTPVIASNIGALASIVDHGRTGLLFEAGKADSLADTLQWALAHPDEMAAMGRRAYDEFMRLYTPESNYATLRTIYDSLRSGSEAASAGAV